MVRGKSQPQNKPRASSTPYVERSSVARALDFSQISVSTASISSISLPSLDVSRYSSYSNQSRYFIENFIFYIVPSKAFLVTMRKMLI